MRFPPASAIFAVNDTSALPGGTSCSTRMELADGFSAVLYILSAGVFFLLADGSVTEKKT